MAEMSSTTDAPTPANRCCAPQAQATCCRPSEKADCCVPGHDEACGCSARISSDDSHHCDELNCDGEEPDRNETELDN